MPDLGLALFGKQKSKGQKMILEMTLFTGI